MQRSIQSFNISVRSAIVFLYTMCSLLLFSAGCSPSGDTITEAGSTTIQPAAEQLAAAYMENNPDITVVIQGGGSSVGVRSAADGTVNIGAASRNLTKSEKEIGLNTFLLARDGIAIVAHPSQSADNLSMDQLKDIYAGNITNWSQIGGEDKEIHVVCREEGSGTRYSFEDVVMSQDGSVIVSTSILQPSNGAVRTTVASDEYAIGFISFGYVDNSIKTLTLDGIEPTLETAERGEYPIVRPLHLLTRGEPRGNVKDFIDFCLGPDGQKIVAEDFIPVYK
jgi:phosphate transport system substrate-binding protein